MKKLIFITGCLFALMMTACNKELSDNFNQYTSSPYNDTIWTRTLPVAASVNDLFDLLAPDRIVDSFDVSKEKEFAYGDSLVINFKANSCVTPGSPGASTGMAKFEIVPLKRKGDFIKFFKPTQTENGSLLVAGAGIFLRVSKDDKEMALAQGSTARIRIADKDTAKPNMQQFYGKEGNPVPAKGIDTAFSWMRDSDTTWLSTWNKRTSPSATTYYGYEMNAKNLRWVAAERYIDSTLPKIKVTATLSPNFTNKNTAVFLVFNDQKTVVNLHADYASRSFFANNIPLGTPCKLISISKFGNDFYLGIENVGGISNNVIRYTIKPNITSFKEIVAYLNSL